MIQPQELRIGNYVEWSNHDDYSEIKAITGKDIEEIEYNHMHPDDPEERNRVHSSWDYIPITPEILDKIEGFEQNQTHKRYWHIEKFRYNTTKMLLDIDTGHRNGEGIGWMCVKIQYLHQLQNLYYALTNKELTFKTNITCTTHESK